MRDFVRDHVYRYFRTKAANDELRKRNERLAAIVSGKLDETRLVSAGPEASGFSINLMDGPVPYLVEYLYQMMTLDRAKDDPCNYVEMRVDHNNGTRMVLTLQRVGGLTPNEKMRAAEARAETAEAKLASLPLPLNQEVGR